MTAEVNAGIQGPVITKMNLKGDVLWSKGYYFASVKDTAAELTPLQDGGFLLLGQWNNPISSFILKLDANGDVVWGLKAITGFKFLSTNRAYVTAHGDYLVAGSL